MADSSKSELDDSRYIVPALERGLLILSQFTRERRQIGAPELSQRLQLPLVPVGSQLGDDVANYAVNSMGNHKISYVIWEQQIYGDWDHQWKQMEDRGSVTANHYDHVHVSFYP